MPLTREQHDTLMKPLKAGRIATRSQGGKTLSYLESWEVRAHLIRLFGFGNFDVELNDYGHVANREYQSQQGKDMVEVIWHARVTLTVRVPEEDKDGSIFFHTLCTYTEAAVGSASGPANMLGEHHDNAIKTAESDALKRCAINLGTQFGLSLYDDGSRADVVKMTLVAPEGEEQQEELSEEQKATLANSLGATVIKEEETGDNGTEATQAV